MAGLRRAAQAQAWAPRRPWGVLIAALLLAGGAAASTSMRFCAQEPARSAAQRDHVLQVAARLRELMAEQGQPAALVARAGTNLQRFGVRYTHAALSLEAHPLAPWAVRQLYFACDERRARLFDQGLSGFLLGADDAERGHVSLLLLPPEAAGPLAQQGLDREAALALLQGEYMANAHPFDLQRQNCNQWLLELLASSWGRGGSRAIAQAQLLDWGYAPEPVHYGSALWRWLAAFVPWIGFDGHPPEDAAARRLVTSLPPDLERLAQRLFPQARRVELCYTPTHWVLRRQGEALDADCTPAEGDEHQRF